MVDHGFGEGKLFSKKATPPEKREIAECISKQPTVLWVHIVRQGWSYSLEEEKWSANPQVGDRNDFIIEFKRRPNKPVLEAIDKCAWDHGQHEITIDYVTIEDESWQNGNPGTHPPHPPHPEP